MFKAHPQQDQRVSRSPKTNSASRSCSLQSNLNFVFFPYINSIDALPTYLVFYHAMSSSRPRLALVDRSICSQSRGPRGVARDQLDHMLPCLTEPHGVATVLVLPASISTSTSSSSTRAMVAAASHGRTCTARS